MSTRISLARVLQLGLLPWESNTFYVMRKRGAWPWVVRSGGRLVIDIDALEKFMRDTAPPWAYAHRLALASMREAAKI